MIMMINQFYGTVQLKKKKKKTKKKNAVKETIGK